MGDNDSVYGDESLPSSNDEGEQGYGEESGGYKQRANKTKLMKATSSISEFESDVGDDQLYDSQDDENLSR